MAHSVDKTFCVLGGRPLGPSVFSVFLLYAAIFVVIGDRRP
mgnify:CR=1 FL=1